MSNTVIRAENIAKRYQLGSIGTGTLNQDLNRWWARMRRKDDPTLKINETRRDGEHWALQDVSFDIKRGEAVGIIGKNGAGKSTLLKILSRVTTPTLGSVKVKGRIASLLEVGTGFHPDLTGRENIFLNGAILGMNKAEIKAKFDEIVSFSGVEKYIDTPVKRYSSGMYVRLAFAVAAHLESEILILDEVLAVGDAEFQKKCLGKMGDVANKEGRTVLFVSHNMAAIKRLCNHGIYLEKGTVACNGNIDLVIDQYLAIGKDRKSISRNGMGGIKVLDVLFKDSQNEEIDSFSTFQEVHIEMHCFAEVPFSNVSFAVCFNNNYETRITSLWTSWLAKNIDVKEGYFKVHFQVPSIKLMPGDYEIITYVDSSGIEIESISNLKKVTVGFTNKFGYVVEPRPSQGLYMEDYDVKITY